MTFSQKINAAAAAAVHFHYTDAILRFNSVAGNHWSHETHTKHTQDTTEENKKLEKKTVRNYTIASERNSSMNVGTSAKTLQSTHVQNT